MPKLNEMRSMAASLPRLAPGLAVVLATGLLLSACNTTAGAGQDVKATGAAITRGANDVKSGL